MISNLIPQLEFMEAARQSDYARGLTQLGGDAAVLKIGGGMGVRMGADFPVNRGMAFGVAEALEYAHLETLEGFLQGLSAVVDVCPLVGAQGLEVLRVRGYAATGFLTVVARDLTTYQKPTLESRVEVREFSADDLETWVETSVAGWGDVRAGGAQHKLAQIGMILPHSRQFGAFLEGQCVGVGAMQVRDGIATLYGGGTRPEARGQGAQTALLHARLEAAHGMGCHWATSSANAGNTSSRNLERAGFAVAYMKVRFSRA